MGGLVDAEPVARRVGEVEPATAGVVEDRVRDGAAGRLDRPQRGVDGVAPAVSPPTSSLPSALRMPAYSGP